MRSCRMLALAALAMGLFACSSENDDGGGSAAQLAIAGSYEDDFGGMHVIADDSWQSGDSAFAITQFSNELRYVIAQNDAANAFNPELWSRFDWTEDSGTLYYCQTQFDAESEQAALDSMPADSMDLDAGCGGFAWSALMPQ